MNGVQARSDPRRRVVFGVDGTPDSLAALRRAASQARKRGADPAAQAARPLRAGRRPAATQLAFRETGSDLR